MKKNTGRILLKYVAFVLIFYAFLTGCSKKGGDDQIVVRVGKERITFQEFLYQFTLFPHFQSGSTLAEARRQHLQYMIDRILMRMAARKCGLDTLPEIRDHIRYIQQKEMLKYLYQKEVLDKISVTDEEAWEEYKKANIQVRIRHLFSPSRDQAWEYYHRLQNGDTFESLARVAFKDTLLANNGGDLGFIPLLNLDPSLADSIYTMRIGELSHPLRSRYGYHVVKVEDVKYNLFISWDEFERTRDQYIKLVKKRKAQQQSARYLATVLKGKTVRIKKRILQQLLDNSQSVILKQPRETPILTPALTDADLDNLREANENLLNQVLVTFDGQQWTVQEFLEKLARMPPLQRPALNRAQTVASQIIDMVRDELLLQEAYRQGLDKAPEVQEAVEQWTNELLADEFRKRLYWVAYKELDEKAWEERKHIFEQLKKEIPIQIYEDRLFQDVPPEKRNERISLVPAVIRDYYIW